MRLLMCDTGSVHWWSHNTCTVAVSLNPAYYLLVACGQQCAQVLSRVVDGLLTQLTQVGGQEGVDIKGVGVLKRQQRTRAVAQELGKLCVLCRGVAGVS